MSDSQLARNIGKFFESFNFESPKEYLPPSLTKLINTNYYSNDTYFTVQEASNGLNSGNENEIYIVLKFLIRILTTKQSDSEINQLFPDIIKNINSPNLKVRRLVYYILLRFSDQQPDTSLLSINAIQKSLSDKNCINRALAIRALSGISIPAILPILLLSLRRTVKDSSPLVRSASAIAIVKCYKLDRVYSKETQSLDELLNDTSSLPYQLYDYLDTLLSDNDARVVGSAIMCYRMTFPGCFDLIHPKISHLIGKLNSLDNYSVILLLDLLTDYAKVFFPETAKDESQLPSQLKQLLSSLQPLIYTNSEAVLLAICRCVESLFPFAVDSLNLVGALLNYSHGSALSDIDETSSRSQALGELYRLLSAGLINIDSTQLSEFAPINTDDFTVAKLKLKILFKLINVSTFDQIFQNIKQFVECGDQSVDIYKYALEQLNNVLLEDLKPEQIRLVQQFFMERLDSTGENSLVNESITGLRQVIQQDISGNAEILIRLVEKLLNIGGDGESSLSPIAKASIVWLLGEFAITSPHYSDDDLKLESVGSNKRQIAILQNYLPDLFRVLLLQFKDMDPLVKLEVLEAFAKLMTIEIYLSKEKETNYELYGNDIFKMFNYLLQLTKYDHDFDIRDRSRLIGSILPNVVYANGVVVNFQGMNVDELLGNDSISAQCQTKLDAVELAVYLFQNKKPKPEVQINVRDSELLEGISKYNQVTKDRLDPGYAQYYDELRAQEFELKDYNKTMSSLSSTSFTPAQKSWNQPSFSTIQQSSKAAPISLPKPKVNKYKLQTLDDFLEDSGSESESKSGGKD